jgi:hypothetical protein
LADVARCRAAIEATGTQVAFVHMSTPEDADPWFDEQGLDDVLRISDPEKTLYRQFGLEEGSLGALSHPRVWLSWFRTAILHGHGVGAPGPDWRQLPGAFVIRSGQILAAIRPQNSAFRPDYLAFIESARPTGAVRA